MRKQGKGRIAVDGWIETDDWFQAIQINGAIDVDTLPSRVGPYFLVFAPLDPTTRADRIVLRMDGIHKINRVILPLGFLELFVLGEELFLCFPVGFAGYVPGLLVHVTQTVKDRGHPALGVGHLIGFLHPMGDRLGREVQVGL